MVPISQQWLLISLSLTALGSLTLFFVSKTRLVGVFLLAGSSLLLLNVVRALLFHDHSFQMPFNIAGLLLVCIALPLALRAIVLSRREHV